MDREEEIATIRGHIAQGERHIVGQRRVIARLQDLGADTALAEDLLQQFESTLAEHRRHLERFLRD